MSLRPGIGAGAMLALADALNTPTGAASVALHGDVPTQLRHEGKSLPLGRYLRRKVREEMGFDDVGGQAKPAAEQHAELSALYEASGSRTAYFTQKPFVEHQRILQIEGKAKLWSKKSQL